MYPWPASLWPSLRPLGLAWPAMAGFSEEVVFHGHLQTRFEAACGTWPRYALVDVGFAFARLPGTTSSTPGMCSRPRWAP